MSETMTKGQNDWQQTFNDLSNAVEKLGGQVQDIDNPIEWTNGVSAKSHATVISMFGLKLVDLTVGSLDTYGFSNGMLAGHLPDNIKLDGTRNFVRMAMSQTTFLAVDGLADIALWITEDSTKHTDNYGHVVYLAATN